MRVNLFELLYRYVYPATRRRLAEILYYDEGLKQEQIAKILGITQSAVSRYIEGQRGALIDFKNIPEVDSKLKKIAKKIVSGKIDEYIVQVEIMRTIFVLLAKKKLCNIHLRVDPTIDYNKCNICPILFNYYVKS